MSLVGVMSCHMFGANPLPNEMRYAGTQEINFNGFEMKYS